MEHWNIGLTKIVGFFSLFHHSTIPLFQNDPSKFDIFNLTI